MSVFEGINWLQLLVTAIAMGCIYSLIATEYTLIYNATGLVNFAHESFIVLGAYIFAGTFERALQFPHILAVICTLVCMAAFGVLVATTVLNPLRNMQFVTYAMFGTMMLSRIILEICRLSWGSLPFTVKGFLREPVNIGSTVLSEAYIYIIVISIIVIAALQAFFKLTKAGKAMICVSQNKDAAALMGINVSGNIRLTVAISSVICGIVGILCAPLFNVSSNMVTSCATKGFCAGVIGGFGSYPGAIIGGILIGLVEQFGIIFIPSVWKDALSFGMMIIFLLIRPSGIIKRKKA